MSWSSTSKPQWDEYVEGLGSDLAWLNGVQRDPSAQPDVADYVPQGVNGRIVDDWTTPEFDQLVDRGEKEYREAMFDWMGSNPSMKGWSPYDMSAYLDMTEGKTGDELLAAQLFAEARAGVNTANAATMKDRNQVLGALAEYKADTFSNEDINQALAREAQTWNAQIQETLGSTINMLASMGQTANPYMLNRLQERLTAEASDALASRRMELELEQANQRQYYVDTLNNVMQATERETLDLETVASVISLLGEGSAYSGSSSSVSSSSDNKETISWSTPTTEQRAELGHRWDESSKTWVTGG